jgi:1-acyl-sn-glycerol-3-phosphate acyltransferase
MSRADESSVSALLARSPRPPAAPASGEPVPPLYRLLRGAVRPLVRRLFALRVDGLEQVPATGPVIVAANHHNYLDGVVLAVALPRPITFLVMPRVYRASPLHPVLHRSIGSIELQVERPDPVALRTALRRLEEGQVVGIFPEGPWSREGRLVEGQPGVALLALRSGVPVVPAAIQGTFQALRGRPAHVPRPHPIAVRFGAPLALGAGRPRRVSRADRHGVTARIMDEIAALLDGRPAVPRPAPPLPAARPAVAEARRP